MEDIEKVIKELLAELDKMQDAQSILLDMSVDNILNKVLGIA